MMTANAIALTLGTMATVAVADDQAPARGMQYLIDHGFEVIAQGRLLERFECDPQLAPITMEEIRRGVGCPTGKATYGSFKRLKGKDGEFVCVSFRDWACYPSQNPN